MNQFLHQWGEAAYTSLQISQFVKMIDKYSKKCKVIVACTELSMVAPSNSNVIDMAQLQIREAIKGKI